MLTFNQLQQQAHLHPARIASGLVCELDASIAGSLTLTGSRVDSWLDQSGNNNHAVTSSYGATYNPKYSTNIFGSFPAVRFDPTATGNATGYAMLALPGIPTLKHNAYTIMMVYNNHWYYEAALIADTTNAVQLFSTGINGRLGTLVYNSANLSSKGVSRIHTVTNSNGLYLDRIGLGKATGTVITFDGVLNSGLGGSVDTGATGVTLIGGNIPNAPTVMAWFDCLAIYIWNRVLSEEEIQAHTRYVSKRFSLPIVRPTHNIIFEGNSIVFGKDSIEVNIVNSSASQLGIPFECFRNFGISGQKISAMTTAFPTRTSPLYDTTILAKRNIVVGWEITNELSTLGISTLEVKNKIEAYAAAVRLAGFKCILGTCLPRTMVGGQNTTFEAQRLEINSWLVTNAGTFFDAVADVASDATIGAPNANTNLTYYSDGIHLKDAGSTIAAPFFANAISAVLA